MPVDPAVPVDRAMLIDRAMPLDRAWIELNIPHHGRMCLLEEVVEWNSQRIRSRATSHRLPDHPLRSNGRLGIAGGIEYAAQTMAAHGALSGGANSGSAGTAGPPEAGFLAGLRDLRLHVLRLDDIESDLICDATLVVGDRGTALYEFVLWTENKRLMSGRATVVFDANRRLSV
jgi:predicted hotdog family 3-hydroxylacyl-ACP dehydratase